MTIMVMLLMLLLTATVIVTNHDDDHDNGDNHDPDAPRSAKLSRCFEAFQDRARVEHSVSALFGLLQDVTSDELLKGPIRGNEGDVEGFSELVC